jgi:tripartite-type tricarboxylate transporter receptor subunit TctC
MAHAQTYPTRLIKIIVPSAPGGIVDVEVRRLAPHLARALGQPVIVDNRPGASNTIGTGVGAKAAPDGYTLTWGTTSPLSIAPVLVPDLPYDPLKDFEPIVQYGQNPAVLVINASLGVRDVPGLVALARSRPGQLNYASNGPAGSLHIMGELVKVTLGIDIVHVPYKAVAQSLLSVVANETQLAFDFPVTCASHIRAGKLVGLFVTGTERVPLIPDVPTAAEIGYPQLVVILVGGLLAPARTPKDIVLRLNAEMLKIMRTPDIAASMHNTGIQVVGGSPDDFRRVIADELIKWRRMVKITGAKME